MPEASGIQRMFAGVAPRYDLLNRVLSLGIDRSWRRAVVESLSLTPETRVLDLCCGTGDLALEIANHAYCAGSDFTWEMLTRARDKARAAKLALPLAAADTLRLPFTAGSFDAATVAFGVRNLEDMPAGLREIRRVLKPGGVLLVLEFSQPTGFLLRLPYRLYLKVILPTIGQLLSRRGQAYRYLAESILGFPDPETLVTMLREAGFARATYERLSGGVVALHRALVEPASLSS